MAIVIEEMEGPKENARSLLHGVIYRRSEWGVDKAKDLEILTKWFRWHEAKVRNQYDEAMNKINDPDNKLN